MKRRKLQLVGRQACLAGLTVLSMQALQHLWGSRVMDVKEEAKASRITLECDRIRLRIWQPESRIDDFGYRT